MFLSDLSIKKPILTTMVVLSLVVLGIYSTSRLGIDIMPKIDFPYVSITVIYPGAGPEEIETLILKPVEDEVGSLAGIQNIYSFASEGVANVVLEFSLGVDVDVAATDVRDKLSLVSSSLPEDAMDPIVQKFDFGASPIMNLAVTSPRPPEETYKIADDIIKQRLSRIEGLASIDLVGGKQREIRVSVSRDRLRALDISLPQVIGTIASANLNLPSGRIEEGGKDFTIRLAGEFASLNELRELQIPVQDRDPVRLREIANVEDTFAEVRELARYKNSPSVGMSLVKKSGANTVQVAREVRREIATLSEIVPPDVEIAIARDSSQFIKDSVMEVASNIMLGILLTALVLFLFLHSWRGTVIAAVSMPASIVATFLLVDMAGFTINVMVLMGLAISVGILVNNSIVVLENITRHEAQGLGSAEATSKGTSEIALAVAASTLTNIVVFAPIAFMSGIVGRIFREFGLTVTFATLFSLLISFTLVPILASRKIKWQLYAILALLAGLGIYFLLGHVWFAIALVGFLVTLVFQATGLMAKLFVAWDKFYENLEESYRNTLAWCLSHRFVFVLAVLVIFVGSMGLFRFVGSEFFPKSDEGAFSISVEMPPGTRLEVTDGVVKKVEGTIKATPEVESWYSMSGTTQTGEMGSNEGTQLGYVYVNLVEQENRTRTTDQVIGSLRHQLADIPAADMVLTPASHFGGGGESDIQIEITGEDMAKLVDLSEQVMEVVNETRGTVDVGRSWKTGKPEVAVGPLRDRIAARGSSAQDIAMTMRFGLEGQVASKYREGEDEYDIRVQFAPEDRSRVEQLESYEIKTNNGWIPLPELSTIKHVSGPTQILRKNKQREVIVTANLAGRPLGDVTNDIQAASKSLLWPEGYRLNMGGQAEFMTREFPYIFQALILAIILTYMLLAAMLESMLQPFTIMFTLPLGLIGAAVIMVLTGKAISMFSLMAFVMLVGIVVNNGILLIDYSNVKRSEGLGLREAVLAACPVRLRPIIMTTIATILGMLPLALGIGVGGGFRAPMAIVSIGALISSTIFTLYLIPVLYTTFESFKEEGGFFHWAWKSWKQL